MNQIESINVERELQLLEERCARLYDDAARCGDDECSSIAARFVRLLHSPHRSTATKAIKSIALTPFTKLLYDRLFERGVVHALVALMSDLDNFCEESLSLLQGLFKSRSLSWRIVAPALEPLVAVLRKYGLNPEYSTMTILDSACETLVDVCKYASTSIPAVQLRSLLSSTILS